MDFHVPGPCSIGWGVSGTAFAIGTTKDGIIITSQMIWTPIIGDKSGGAPLDWIFGGRNITVNFIVNNVIAIPSGFFIGNFGVSDPALTGTLVTGASADMILKITESTPAGGDVWQMPVAVPLDPPEILLQATKELEIPYSFKLLPGPAGKMFTAIPSYLDTAEA